MPEILSRSVRPARFNWRKWERFVRRKPENSYSRRVSSLVELPESARQALEALLAAGEVPQLIIFAPYQTVLGSQPVLPRHGERLLAWEYTRDRVIVLTDRRLITVDLEEDGQAGEISLAPLEAILALQSGKILLFSWLDWTWAEDGGVRNLRCYFNTVCEEIYFRLAEGVRSRISPAGSFLQTTAVERAAELRGLSFKFRNMLPLYLLEGEPVEQAVFRPSVWERWARLWRVHKLPKGVLLVAGAHLLLAEEELTRSEDAYGLIVTWLPRSRIEELRVAEEADRVVVCVQTGACGAHFETRFAAQRELRAELDALAGRL